jgi:hypothetical protein
MSGPAMSDSEKPAPANQTIQIDALDSSEALSVTGAGPSEASPGDEHAAGRRKTPPPLPPSALVSNPPPSPQVMTSRPPSAPPPAPRSMGQKVAIGAAFVVLVAGAIAGGLAVGGQARGKLAAPAASSAAPSPSASEQVLTLPTIEMTAPPSGN